MAQTSSRWGRGGKGGVEERRISTHDVEDAAEICIAPLVGHQINGSLRCFWGGLERCQVATGLFRTSVNVRHKKGNEKSGFEDACVSTMQDYVAYQTCLPSRHLSAASGPWSACRLGLVTFVASDVVVCATPIEMRRPKKNQIFSPTPLRGAALWC